MTRRSITFVSPEGLVTQSYLALSFEGRLGETDADREREMLEAIRAEQHEYEQVESDA